MDIHAHTKHIRMSPRRIRLIADVVRGLPVAKAEQQLFAISRRATVPLQKLLVAAIANAEQNFDCVKENLYIKAITVNEGPMLKRFRPRAFGRATSLRKRSAHLTIVLGELAEGKRGGKARRESSRMERGKGRKHAHEHVEEQKAMKPGEEAQVSHAGNVTTPGRVAARHHVEGAKENTRGYGKSKGFLKRLFNRKAG